MGGFLLNSVHVQVGSEVFAAEPGYSQMFSVDAVFQQHPAAAFEGSSCRISSSLSRRFGVFGGFRSSWLGIQLIFIQLGELSMFYSESSVLLWFWLHEPVATFHEYCVQAVRPAL